MRTSRRGSSSCPEVLRYETGRVARAPWQRAEIREFGLALGLRFFARRDRKIMLVFERILLFSEPAAAVYVEIG
jgi:hypothetical protein